MSFNARLIQVAIRGMGLMALMLGLASCGEQDSSATAAELQYPCGPFFTEHYTGYQRHFLEWTPDGSKIMFDYIPRGYRDLSSLFPGRMIWLAASDGSEARMLVDANPGGVGLFNFHADVSPDGTRIVYATCEFPTESIHMESFDSERRQLHYEIAVINLDGSGQQRLTVNEHLDHFPVWSPDGNTIVFIANPHERSLYNTATAELYAMAADGSDVRLVVSTLNKVSTETEGYYYWRNNAFNTQRGVSEIGNPDEPWLWAVTLAAPAWSPDGGRLAFLVDEGESPPLRHLLYMARADGSELMKVAETAGVQIALPGSNYNSPITPTWEPSGERLAFVGVNEAGGPGGVFTIRHDGTDRKLVLEPQGPDWQVWHLSWSPDGSEILVVSTHGTFAIEMDGGGFRTLNSVKVPRNSLGVVAAWSPDSTRIAFYIAREIHNEPPQLFTVARDGTDRRDLIRLDADGNLVPANPPQEKAE